MSGSAAECFSSPTRPLQRPGDPQVLQYWRNMDQTRLQGEHHAVRMSGKRPRRVQLSRRGSKWVLIFYFNSWRSRSWRVPDSALIRFQPSLCCITFPPPREPARQTLEPPTPTGSAGSGPRAASRCCAPVWVTGSTVRSGVSPCKIN